MWCLVCKIISRKMQNFLYCFTNKGTYQYPKAAVMKYYRPGGLKNRKLLFPNCGSWKSKIRVSSGWLLLGSMSKKTVPSVSLVSPHYLPCVPIYSQISFSYNDTSHKGLGLTLMTSFLLSLHLEDPRSILHSEITYKLLR
jgi:hypothetical protein